MRVFDKKPYEGEPDVRIREVIGKLEQLGSAVVAVRGPGFSANLAGVVYIGKDGDDPVLKVEIRGDGCIERCGCHIHLMWSKIHSYVLELEDVGYGPEPVVYLLDEHAKPVVNLFYPGKTFAEVEAVLASA